MSNETDFNTPVESQRDGADASGVLDTAPLPLILAMDTATEERSLAVVRGTEVLASHMCEQGGANSSTLLGEVERVLRRASVTVREIDLYAVAAGPGSFTGLRSGLATVKGLAKTLRKQAVGVPTLHAIAHAALPAESLLALTPAGRGEVFAQHLGLGADGTISELGSPMHVSPVELIEFAKGITGSLTWAGGGATKYGALFEDAAQEVGIPVIHELTAGGVKSERAWYFPKTFNPLAVNIAALALFELQRGGQCRVENLKALYVRAADARMPQSVSAS